MSYNFKHLGYKDLDGTAKTDALFLASDLDDEYDNPDNTFTRKWVAFNVAEHGLANSIDKICEELVALGFKEVPAPGPMAYL